ncbi:mycofactocin biosynthesis chaperone MftB [Ferrimicrobium sp.]|uniref:mycofactocin biosynthesis chaperone MftB n=1 Tax=Ferrimicrobium sp. TaxID=2926050 RepID=UPI002635BB85|nr:mycofactocin biosynthesis chaperone MftB [Ferrimicrobium sp.]
MELRWRLAPHVQMRSERFGAIAYNSREQRLTLLHSSAIGHLPGLLLGVSAAAVELSALGLTREQLDDLLAQLWNAGILEPLAEVAQPIAQPGTESQ